MSNPSTAEIRQFLTDAFGDQDLKTLCADYFRDVYEEFTAGMTKSQMIQLVLDYGVRREVIPNLMTALERTRPEQVRNRFPQSPRMDVSPEPAAIARDP